MEEKNKIYTAADFANYYAGTMPPNEMHSLEKAALEDPFLADALEGYAYTASPEKDIDELRVRLAEKNKKKKVFFISAINQNKWWAVAASIIIMLGIGFFFYRTNKINTQNTLAKNDIRKAYPKAEAPALILKDSSVASNDVAFENSTAPEISIKRNVLPKTIQDKKFEKAYPQPITSIDKNDESSVSMAETNDSENSISLLKSESKADTTKQYVLKGKIIDDKGNPVPFAIITTMNKKEGITANDDGEFSLSSSDSNAKVATSAVGFYSKEVLLKKDVEPVIIMNNASAGLSEVVVTGYSAKRKKALSSQSKNLQGRVAGAEITKQVIQPFPVNEKFNQYINDNLITVYDDDNEKVSGNVQLSFSINKKGRPQQVTVLKSTCKECEEQAIHLLEAGPDWEGKKNILGMVEIKFE